MDLFQGLLAITVAAVVIACDFGRIHTEHNLGCVPVLHALDSSAPYFAENPSQDPKMCGLVAD
jgi:hypothetical protein